MIPRRLAIKRSERELKEPPRFKVFASRIEAITMTKAKWSEGEIEAVVIATGVHPFFGKAAHLVDTTDQLVTSKRQGINSIIFLAWTWEWTNDG